METTTVLGIVAGFACIIISILIGEGGQVSNFIDIPSIFIVVGGTLFATMASYRGEALRGLATGFKFGLTRKKVDLLHDIEMIIDLANIARRDGLLAMESMVQDIKDPFLTKSLMLTIDGTAPEVIRDIMEDEISFMQERHAIGQAMFESMASYAPAFGMVGTLIGLINMLQTLSDTASLGPNMSVALVTTFYGVVFANLLFNPIARKLKAATQLETQRKELLLAGILAINDGENPRLIRERLTSYISNENLRKKDSRGGNRPVETEEMTR